jgi:hypothetical protein
VAVAWASRWCVAIARCFCALIFWFWLSLVFCVVFCLVVFVKGYLCTVITGLAARLRGEGAQFGLYGRLRFVLLWVGQVLLYYQP